MMWQLLANVTLFMVMAVVLIQNKGLAKRFLPPVCTFINLDIKL